MDYEQRCKNLVKAVKELQEANPSDEGIQNWVNENVPELVESSGDRIRQALIKFHKSTIEIDGIKGYDILSWLKKQGEQKSVDKAEQKFKVGDWIIHQGTENICQVVAHIDNQYQLKHGDNYTVLKCADVDRCARLWDITKDAKEGDVLATDDCVFIFKKLNARGKPVCYCHYDDELGFKVDVNSYLATGSEIYPATIERRNILKKAMADAGYEWDSEKKELKEIEQEPAWSVKDEAGLGDALWAIQQARTIAKDETDMGNLWYAENWLNSLKERLQKS